MTLNHTAFDLERRFGGLQRLFGESAKAIFNAHVVVVGLGGVGSWAAEALARSGVGQLTLIDLDHISESNINRQIQALTSTLGQAKVVALKERIQHINPLCQVHVSEEFVNFGNWAKLLPVSAHAVLDACDQVSAKTHLAAWARTVELPFVTVGAAGGKTKAQQVDVADLGEVTHDPLLAKVRNQLRKAHGAPAAGKRMSVSCVFSREPLANSGGTGSLNCSGYGSWVTVTATFGMTAAGYLMEQLMQTGSEEKKLNYNY
jgi:tRNA A37 threonylcarbamoyladenosine dehydratase